jgi:N-acetylglutamate synthase-like GNAT family acetyltransferase
MAYAAEAGWRVPQLERQLFEGPWAEHALVQEAGGAFCGLVTAVPHHKSGWIGNLIVASRLRGRGNGRRLFAAALEELTGRGMTSIWLTASEQGRPLYQQYGFEVVGQIERWVLPPGRKTDVRAVAGAPLAQLLQADRDAWGEDRSPFLRQLAGKGQLFCCEDALALLQSEKGLQLLGPWYSGSGTAQRPLLTEIVAAADPARELVVDLFSSSSVQPWLAAAGFVRCGRSPLMARGETSAVQLQRMVSLASLGSVG